MILYLQAVTSVPDLIIDYIEVEKRGGTVVSLNWDESEISRSEWGFSARYKGVYFDEEYANGKLDELKKMRITCIGLYSEKENNADISVRRMTFLDAGRGLHFSGLLYSAVSDANG